MSNVIQFPGAQPEPEFEPEAIVIRVVIQEPPAPPFITPIGVLVAILSAIGTFVLVSTVL